MRVLHIDSSTRVSGTTSRRLSARFVEELARRGPPLEVHRLDLALSPPRHLGAVETALAALAEAWTRDARGDRHPA